MFLKNRNISSKIKRSKVTDYAALSNHFPLRLWFCLFLGAALDRFSCTSSLFCNQKLFAFRIAKSQRVLAIQFALWLKFKIWLVFNDLSFLLSRFFMSRISSCLKGPNLINTPFYQLDIHHMHEDIHG